MTAGTGADHQAQLVASRVEQKRRELERLEQQQRNWAAGADGERLVAAEIDQLRAHGWIVLHDLHWPGRPKANLDHVLIGPGGVLVVDAKNWSGAVTVRDGVLRCSGYRKDREVESALTQAADVAALVEPQHRSLVSGAICLVQQDLEPQSVQGATLLGHVHLREFAAQLPIALNPAEVAAIGGYLERTLSGPTSPQQLTSGHAAATVKVPVAPITRSRARQRPTSARPAKTPKQPTKAEMRRRSQRMESLLKLLFIALAFLTAPLWFPLFTELLTAIFTSAIPDVPAVPTPAETSTAPAP